MKRFKIFVSTAFLIAACNVFLQAQDLNTAIEAYNLGATAAQEGNYVTAIEHLDRALELGSALGEEGASVVTDCKNLIPQLYLRYAKELAANGDVASSLPFLDKAAETAVKYGDQTGIQDEVKDLTSKVYYIIANEAFGKKDFAGAIESYKKVLELDPTNDLVPGSDHVRLALGRDYGDVTPLRGVMRGAGRHAVDVAVNTRRLPELQA